jgi:hypothetical protein
MRNTAQWARYFVLYAFKRLFQQPQLDSEVQSPEIEVRFAPESRHSETPR